MMILSRLPIQHGGATRSSIILRSMKRRFANSTNKGCAGEALRHSPFQDCALCALKDGQETEATGFSNRAIYVENSAGNPMFTGVVQAGDNSFIKLDDPKCDIAEPVGHEMDITELAAEWIHYGVDDQFAKVRHDLDRRLVDFANYTYERVQNELTLADGSYAVDTVDFDLMLPFPTLYEYPYENPFDPNLRKSVRSLDAAMLLSRGKRELFWTTVMGVCGWQNYG